IPRAYSGTPISALTEAIAVNKRATEYADVNMRARATKSHGARLLLGHLITRSCPAVSIVLTPICLPLTAISTGVEHGRGTEHGNFSGFCPPISRKSSTTP